ncbi:MAG: hypothetical protein J5988_02115 [Eubacterium sp.]|nr:hypothetical protein [Eubacterium sp.]
MFREEYKRAYDNIYPDRDSIDRILERTEKRKIPWVVRPVMVSLLAVILCLKTVVPVMANHIPAVYHVIEEYVPGLADFILPQEVSSTSKGITMQVEAIDIVDNTAEILISFRDAENSDKNRIKGGVDLYDSYHLQNYGAGWQAGGCHFLEYDEVEDKAYFKIDLSASEAYEKNRVRFRVRQLLTNYVREERKIDLTNLLTDPKEKSVFLSGIGGMEERALFPFFDGRTSMDDPRFQARVMDIVVLNESMMEDLIVTGVAYDEGVLRVQSCRGTFSDADRHLRPYLKNDQGNEIQSDCSVGWQEEINGERVLFDEHWFLISEEELENYELYGMFYITDGSVKGNWEVTFKVE